MLSSIFVSRSALTLFALGTSTAIAAPLQVATLDNLSAERSTVQAPGATAGPVAGPAIINGEAAGHSDYPMSGGLIIDTTLDIPGFGVFPLPDLFICSSTLIAPDVVLTAAHCLDPDALTMGFGESSDTEFYWTTAEDLTAYTGEREQELPEGTVQAVDWVFHPDFSLTALEIGLSDNHDIALVFLSEPVLDIQPAILPTVEEGAALEAGLEVVVVGWGQQIATSGFETPPEGSIQIKQMGESTIAESAAFEFKVGEVESDVRKCHGDSGGPSFAMVGQGTGDDMRLIGVTSHAYDNTDCNETGGVDTRVDFHLAWIDAEMRAACSDGTRVWCDEPGILPTDYFDVGEDAGGGDDGGIEDELDELDEDDGEDGKGSGCSVGTLSAMAFPALMGLGMALRRRE